MLPKDHRSSTETRMLFNHCVMLAEQIPYSHPLQLKLVGLLDCIHSSPQITLIFEAPDGTKRELSGHWMTYSLLVDSMREQLNGPDLDVLGDFVNLNAFLAHLMERRIMGSDPTWAIIALHDALEEECKETGGFKLLYRNELVSAAAQWILWCGQSLFMEVLYPGEVDPQKLKGSWSTGKLYRGEGGLSVERWHFWRDGFKAVAAGAGEKKGGYGEECKDAVARAASLMETLEKAMTF